MNTFLVQFLIYIFFILWKSNKISRIFFDLFFCLISGGSSSFKVEEVDWALTLKYNSNGIIKWYKARVMAKEFIKDLWSGLSQELCAYYKT